MVGSAAPRACRVIQPIAARRTGQNVSTESTAGVIRKVGKGMSNKSEIDRLADFILKHYPDEIGMTDPPSSESAVDVVIRLLSK